MTPPISIASSVARSPAFLTHATATQPTKRLKSFSLRWIHGAGALACCSGMAALHLAIAAALVDRRRVILAASALYAATISPSS